jgi:hypothetical protein
VTDFTSLGFGGQSQPEHDGFSSSRPYGGLMTALGGVGHVGRAYLVYRLARFAFRGPIWHPIVAVLVIAALVGVNLLQQRRRGGPRR